MKRYFSIIIVFTISIFIFSCTTTKRKEDVSGLKKFYQNTTAKFNGYFNADVLLNESIIKLEEMHEDNYNQLLEVYKYSAVDDPKGVSADLDKAIEKVSIVATLHSPSNWVDDCYVLMGKAQYLKQDYESAEETLEYFAEEFDPKNASLRKKKKSKETLRKEKLKEKKEERKIREKEVEEKKEARELEKEDLQKEKEKQQKAKKKVQKEKQKEREKDKKARKKAQKEKQKERDRKLKERKKSAKKNRANNERNKSLNVKTKEIKTDSTKKDIEGQLDKKEVSSLPSSQVKKRNPEKREPKKELKKDKQTSKADAKKDIPENEEEEEEKKGSKKEIINESANEGGFFKRKPAYQDGLLWLAKTYIERERWAVAAYWLNKLEGFDLINNIAEQMPAVHAYYHLKQKEYSEAIPFLEEAIILTKSKKLRARYAFILGQLQQMLGQEDKAYTNFELVTKWKPGYEMEFHARMNMAKNAWATGSESTESVIKRLTRMLNEDKNTDFKGEIYYTIADIKLRQNNTSEAIENLEKSIKYNTSNTAQKTESYYTLAKLYYEDERYVNSKLYFDSTLTVMKKLDPRMEEVKNYSENLRDIAKNIQIIEEQDSLLRISNMSDDDKKALAQKIKEEREAARGVKEEQAESYSFGRMSSTRIAGTRPSSFFAYNEVSLRKGSQDFIKKWNTIKLEDDWRRSNKSTSLDIEEESESEEEEVNDISSTELKAILKGVPNNPGEIARVNEMIKNAMFELGVLYRERLKNYPKSVDILEQLLKRYPNSEKELESYYYLYLGYLDLSNISKSNYYKEEIITKFPESIYAKSLTDPNFAANFRKEEKKIVDHYNQTYEYFDAAEFDKAFENIQKTEELFGKEYLLKPKFALLKAMCIGNISGKAAYMDELKNVIAKYPNTAEQTRAKEIMRFLRGDKQVFDKVDKSVAKSDFKIQDDKLHYIIVVVYSSDDSKINSSKISISNFNKNFFKDSRLKISGIPLSNADESNIILVRKFSNREKAMEYYAKAEKESDGFISKDVEYEVFAVTQKNYREVIKQRSVNNYRIFFESHYSK